MLSIMNSTADHIIVVSQDTDVLVILIANYRHFGNKKVYFQQQTAKEKKITDVKEVVEALKAQGICPESVPLLHAITGCDTTSYLYGIGKHGMGHIQGVP